MAADIKDFLSVEEALLVVVCLAKNILNLVVKLLSFVLLAKFIIDKSFHLINESF